MVNTRFSTALHLLVLLAVRRMAGDDSVLSSDFLAERVDAHPVSVRRALAELKQDGLATGVRGPGGGFRLGKDPSEISLGQIADTIDLEPAFDSHEIASDDPSTVDFHIPSVLHSIRSDLNTAIFNALDERTLEDVVHSVTLRRDLAELVSSGLSDAEIRSRYEIIEGRLVKRNK